MYYNLIKIIKVTIEKADSRGDIYK